ncbi:MAG: ribonuclease H-like domain-containing protein, partial [Mogibacterium sp.]|nr:ribonuclease H-like domain-containing protein [Mogibacterium sp.]
MKVFTRDYRITGEYHPEWDAYFSGMKPCVLDIEATGLDRSRCKAILIGLLMRTDSGVRITQFLAENHYEEDKVLEAA